MPTYTPQTRPTSAPSDLSDATWTIVGELSSPLSPSDVKFSAKGNAFLPISIKSGKFFYRSVVFDAPLIDRIVMPPAGSPSLSEFHGSLQTRKNESTGKWELQIICTSAQ